MLLGCFASEQDCFPLYERVQYVAAAMRREMVSEAVHRRCGTRRPRFVIGDPSSLETTGMIKAPKPECG
jgi:hypothetical protein